ncbi:pyruvate kinase 1, cytosolic [Olea europaea subsp. europaea]|uniref:Pyruvate kinase 1, cytosolic n=1 Tax=Olea europaea subsp. europaea TaxID=158383 RepID=A0A8S0R006_OLEEU|nr:pyruvate kinase 1, cytosolic [Olea europaea subsp. europaea]
MFQVDSTKVTNKSVLKVGLDHGKASGVIKSHNQIVVCQKVGDAFVVGLTPPDSNALLV